MPISRLQVIARFDADKPIHIADIGIKNRQCFFQYTQEAQQKPLSFSPEHIETHTGVQSYSATDLPDSFLGIPGLLADALPDSWGRSLFRRALSSLQIDSRGLTALDMLSFIGESGLGALSFRPSEYTDSTHTNNNVTLTTLLEQVSHVSATTTTVDKQFVTAALPSGGARPKVLIQKQGDKLSYCTGTIDEEGESWLLKFPDRNDFPQSGKVEYLYHLLALSAGITVPDAELWGDEYFAVKRFDRQGNKRQHMHSLSGLLHRNFTDFNLSIDDFLLVTKNLTGSVSETLEAFRRAVFNRVFCNMDDHAKNHAYLMDASGKWVLSPAYDLTFSDTLGIHPMSWLGTSAGLPKTEDLLQQATQLDIRKGDVTACIEQVMDTKNKVKTLAEPLSIDTGYLNDIVRIIA